MGRWQRLYPFREEESRHRTFFWLLILWPPGSSLLFAPPGLVQAALFGPMGVCRYPGRWLQVV